MADPTIKARGDREYRKFRDAGADGTCVAVCGTDGGNVQTDAVFSGLSVAIKVTTITVGTTEVALPATALSGRNSISINNKDSTTTLYLGPTGVTADDAASTGGWEVPPQFTFGTDITDAVTIYGIVASGSITVKILELA